MTAGANQRLSYLYVLIAAVLWGSSFAVIKLLLGELDSLQIVFFQNVFACIGLAIGATLLKQPLHQQNHSARTYLRLAGLGLMGTFLYDFLLFESLRLLPAQAASTINYLWPIMVVVFAVLILKETLTPRKIGGLLIAFFGVAIVITGGRLTAITVGSVPGVLFDLAAAVTYGLFSVLDSRETHHKFVSTAWYFFFGSIYGLIAVLLWSHLPQLNLNQLFGLGYLGIFTSGLGYVCWLLALRHGDTAKVSTMIFLTPFFSLVFTALLLHEVILLSSVIGLAVIVAGVLLSSYDRG